MSSLGVPACLCPARVCPSQVCVQPTCASPRVASPRVSIPGMCPACVCQPGYASLGVPRLGVSSLGVPACVCPFRVWPARVCPGLVLSLAAHCVSPAPHPQCPARCPGPWKLRGTHGLMPDSREKSAGGTGSGTAEPVLTTQLGADGGRTAHPDLQLVSLMFFPPPDPPAILSVEAGSLHRACACEELPFLLLQTRGPAPRHPACPGGTGLD